MTCVRSSSEPDTAFLKSSSMQFRNAASVLPDPVGAAIRTSAPDRIAGQLRVWTSVGSLNLSSNQDAMTGWKNSSAMKLHCSSVHHQILDEEFHHPLRVQTGVPLVRTNLKIEALARMLQGLD